MKFKNVDEWEECIIARDDSDGYDPSGWIIVVKDGMAGITKFGHCSCYGTLTDLGVDGSSRWHNRVIDFEPELDYECGIDEMYLMAKNKIDPDFRDRTADEKDYDYKYLAATYAEYIEWYDKIKKGKEE